MSMPAKSANLSKKPRPTQGATEVGTVRLLRAMGLTAVQVSPGIVALSAKPKKL